LLLDWEPKVFFYKCRGKFEQVDKEFKYFLPKFFFISCSDKYGEVDRDLEITYS
jgi:hypothetical protein